MQTNRQACRPQQTDGQADSCMTDRQAGRQVDARQTDSCLTDRQIGKMTEQNSLCK